MNKKSFICTYNYILAPALPNHNQINFVVITNQIDKQKKDALN